MIIGGFYTISSLAFMYSFRRWFDRIMKKQCLKGSLIESIGSTGVGFIFTYITGLLMLPYFGMTAVASITFVTILSLGTTVLRRFLFRRMFEHYGASENLYTLALRLINKIKNKTSCTECDVELHGDTICETCWLKENPDITGI